MLDKLLKVLDSIPDKDQDLINKQQQLIEENNQIATMIAETRSTLSPTPNDDNRALKENEKKKERDMLFGDKQKW